MGAAATAAWVGNFSNPSRVIGAHETRFHFVSSLYSEHLWKQDALSNSVGLSGDSVNVVAPHEVNVHAIRCT